MKTDVIMVSSNGKQMEKALEQVDRVASYKDLPARSALQLRLLTEEMMGMIRSITGEKQGEFWIEDEAGVYQLHLRVNTRMNMDKREQLLAASTSGKNEAARGLMGRLRDFFDQGSDASAMPLYYAEMPGEFTGSTLDWEWSMVNYENALSKRVRENDQAAKDAWDELEKSVVARVADDVKVFIRGREVEMVIYKKM